ncbi:MAG: endonuclease/exonuclease/phosphatase family protein [Hamadaea sp.]|nr:endonuclease/exonuclease/phosphatase family protein [Hamadaea sp.]
MRLATFNVENLFARAKALDTDTWADGRPALAAFESFNKTAAKKAYSEADKAKMLADLTTLKVLVPTTAGLRLNKKQFDTAWALLRENRGDFLAAPTNAEPRIVATGRGDWIGWVELITEPVDETAIRMTARVVTEVAADILCVVEAESRPSLVRFNDELLAGRYGHAMLIDGNDLRGIDVGLMCTADIDIRWVRSHVDTPDPANPQKRLFSRDCPAYHLRLPSGADLYVLLNHLKSQSFTSGDPDPLRTRQADEVLEIYNRLRDEGAELVAILGDFNKGPDKDDPAVHPTLGALLDPGAPLVNAYDLAAFQGLFDPKDTKRQRPGTFQSCSLSNRLDYILLSPELADLVVDGGVFRKGLWGDPGNINPPKLWSVYPEITAGRHAASDHGAVWVDLDL